MILGSITFGPASEANDEIFNGLLTRNGVENCLFVPGTTRIFDLSWLNCEKGKTFEVICNAVWQDGVTVQGSSKERPYAASEQVGNSGIVFLLSFE